MWVLAVTACERLPHRFAHIPMNPSTTSRLWNGVRAWTAQPAAAWNNTLDLNAPGRFSRNARLLQGSPGMTCDEPAEPACASLHCLSWRTGPATARHMHPSYVHDCACVEVELACCMGAHIVVSTYVMLREHVPARCLSSKASRSEPEE